MNPYPTQDAMDRLINKPSVDRSTGAMPGQHNKAADKARRLQEFGDKNPEDTPVRKPSFDNNKTPSEMNEADLAYQILSAAGKDNPIYFKTLIREIIAKKNKVVQNEAAAISEIYTMINMDSRFQHVKDGLWGLADWYPPEVKRTRGASKSVDKTSDKKSSTSSRLKAEEEPEDLS